MNNNHSGRTWCLALALTGMALTAGTSTVRASRGGSVDDEQEVGQQVFNELKAKGEIISSPNAFATPGGNVYVTDSLLYFVKNTEELAGTLCYEMSHTIHHDSMNLIEKERAIERRQLGAAVLLGPSKAHILAIALIGKLQSLGYSREAESAADVTGSDVCAESGYNPWGLVWLFQDFDAANLAQVPQLLSDHPDNPHRVETLKRHFGEKPAIFGSFSSDSKTAKPFTVPKDAPESFLR